LKILKAASEREQPFFLLIIYLKNFIKNLRQAQILTLLASPRSLVQLSIFRTLVPLSSAQAISDQIQLSSAFLREGPAQLSSVKFLIDQAQLSSRIF
jgi:hypothetical protein